MRDQSPLARLEERYRSAQVLSVYLPGTAPNPADRRQWEVQFERELARVRDEMRQDSHDERISFERCVGHLRNWLMHKPDPARSEGLLLIVAPEGVTEELPASTSIKPAVCWRVGAHLAPLLGAAALGPRGIVVVVDSRSARLMTFEPPATLAAVEELRAEPGVDVERHLGAPNGAFHPGTRGGTTADELERVRRIARDRMCAQAMTRAAELSGEEGWVVLAGSAKAVAAATRVTPPGLSRRVIPAIHVSPHIPLTELLPVVTTAIAERVAARDAADVRTILEAHGARGRGVAGLAATRISLEGERVADLLVTPHFVERHPVDADDLVRHALASGAQVRRVEGAAADEADARGEGVVARLRYVPELAGESTVSAG